MNPFGNINVGDVTWSSDELGTYVRIMTSLKSKWQIICICIAMFTTVMKVEKEKLPLG